MITPEDRDEMWKALLAAVNELTRLQPGSHEYGSPGSGWWAAPHGSNRGPAIYDSDRVAVVFDIGRADGTWKKYHLQVVLAAQDGDR